MRSAHAEVFESLIGLEDLFMVAMATSILFSLYYQAYHKGTATMHHPYTLTADEYRAIFPEAADHMLPRPSPPEMAREVSERKQRKHPPQRRVHLWRTEDAKMVRSESPLDGLPCPYPGGYVVIALQHLEDEWSVVARDYDDGIVRCLCKGEQDARFVFHLTTSVPLSRGDLQGMGFRQD